MSKASRNRRAWLRYQNGGTRKVDRGMRSYSRWIRSMLNVKTRDKYGNTFWAFDRPVLIHKGRKP